MGGGIGTAVPVKSFRISNQFLNFRSKRGRVRSAGKFSEKNERETFTERRGARPAHEFLAFTRSLWAHRQLFES
jgi:hypothetical protein